jgi:hypothetical protein
MDPLEMLAGFSSGGGGCGEVVVYADLLDSGIDGWECLRADPTGLVAAGTSPRGARCNAVFRTPHVQVIAAAYVGCRCARWQVPPAGFILRPCWRHADG